MLQFIYGTLTQSPYPNPNPGIFPLVLEINEESLNNWKLWLRNAHFKCGGWPIVLLTEYLKGEPHGFLQLVRHRW